jgi:hypothetical protein
MKLFIHVFPTTYFDILGIFMPGALMPGALMPGALMAPNRLEHVTVSRTWLLKYFKNN